jgi:hypothetical protein
MVLNRAFASLQPRSILRLDGLSWLHMIVSVLDFQFRAKKQSSALDNE